MKMAVYLHSVKIDMILSLYEESQKVLKRKYSRHINERTQSSLISDSLSFEIIYFNIKY